MSATETPLPPRQTANPAPPRPAGSIRRTCSIDVSWPDGETGDRLFIGRVRDYRTPADGGPGTVLDQAEFRASLDQEKTIRSIVAEPAPQGVEKLVGVRGGNHLRLFIKENMPELIEQGMPIYLALDDISGTALVSAFAWSQWYDDWADRMRKAIPADQFEKLLEQRLNICWGLQEGNSGVARAEPPRNVAEADAGDVRNPADPLGWHELPESSGPGFRRARRIDMNRDDAAGLIRIDAAFQDSAARKSTGRVAIHEYTLTATADLATGELLTLEPKGHILPFWECPGAITNTARLVGTRLGDIRTSVLDQLRGAQGCTHLNDALRALAEVPLLASKL